MPIYPGRSQAAAEYLLTLGVQEMETQLYPGYTELDICLRSIPAIPIVVSSSVALVMMYY